MSDVASADAVLSLPGRERRLAFMAQGLGLQPASREIARRGVHGTTLHMSQTSPQVVQPHAERRDGSPTASSIVEGGEEMHGGGVGGDGSGGAVGVGGGSGGGGSGGGGSGEAVEVRRPVLHHHPG